MLDRLPVLGQPAPHALDQRNRIRSEFRRRHLTEPVLERVRHVDLLPVAPYRGLPVHQPTERRFGVGWIMFGVGNVNGLACPGRHEYLHGGLVVAAGAAIEGFSNVRVRFDFPARNGLTKFGVAWRRDRAWVWPRLPPRWRLSWPRFRPWRRFPPCRRISGRRRSRWWRSRWRRSWRASLM